jgi:hypothetical protein
LHELLTYTSLLSVVLPICFSIIRLKNLSLSFRLLFLFLLIALLTEIVSFYFSRSNKVAYNLTQNSYTLIEGILLSLIYYIEYKSKLTRRIILLFIIYLIIHTFIKLCNDSSATQNAIIIWIECLVMMGLSLSFFFGIFAELTIPRGVEYPFFWFNCSILFYFATSIILFLFLEHLADMDKATFSKIEGLNFLANIVHNSLFAIGIWKTKKI